MNCRDIEDSHVVDRYVQGRLPSDEAEGFEDHYMECAQCQQALEEAAIRHRGFKRYAAEETGLGTRGESAEASAENPAASLELAQTGSTPSSSTLTPSPLPPPTPIHRRRRWQPLVGSLAALLALAVGVRWWVPNMPATSTGTEVAFLQVERSTGDGAPSHLLEQPAEGMVLILELDPPFYETYHAALEHHGEVVWNAESLHVGERDTVSLNLSADLLQPGDFQLRLSSTTEDGRQTMVGRFSFRVVPLSD